MADFQPTQANCIWHDSTGNTYYSNGTEQYKVVNNNCFKVVKWSGVESFYASYVWHDAEGNVYLYEGDATYKLSGTTWKQVEMTLPVEKDFAPLDVWHDHDRTFYTYIHNNTSYTYELKNGNWEPHELSNSTIGYGAGRYVWHDLDGNSYMQTKWSAHYNNGKNQLKLVGDTWTPVTFETPVPDGDLTVLKPTFYCYNNIVIDGVLHVSSIAYMLQGNSCVASGKPNKTNRSDKTVYLTSIPMMWQDSTGSVYFTNNFAQNNNDPDDFATYKLANNEWQEVTFTVDNEPYYEPDDGSDDDDDEPGNKPDNKPDNPFESGMSYGKATRRYLDLDGMNTLALSVKRYVQKCIQDVTGVSQVEHTHNIPRLIPKDITSYVSDGTIWARLNGTRGTDETSGVPNADKYYPCEDIYVGDYWKMSRPITAYERTGTYQMTGSEWVTIAGIDTMWGSGDTGNANTVLYHHLVMVPGKGFAGKQHFGRSRMNSGNTTAGGYKGSEMNTVTIGPVATAGATGAQATINQQLYAEFGARLKTTREMVSNNVNANGYNRYGSATGCSSEWEWVSAQAILMSEVEVYGSIVWSSSGHDTGNARVQLPLFAFSKKAQNSHGPDASGENAYWWLKDVSASSEFCRADEYGHAYLGTADRADIYVRPRFVLGA